MESMVFLKDKICVHIKVITFADGTGKEANSQKKMQ